MVCKIYNVRSPGSYELFIPMEKCVGRSCALWLIAFRCRCCRCCCCCYTCPFNLNNVICSDLHLRLGSGDPYNHMRIMPVMICPNRVVELMVLLIKRCFTNSTSDHPELTFQNITLYYFYYYVFYLNRPHKLFYFFFAHLRKCP